MEDVALSAPVSLSPTRKPLPFRLFSMKSNCFLMEGTTKPERMPLEMTPTTERRNQGALRGI